MTNKKSRFQLYDKFRQGAIPTGADFGELIRSSVNVLDDGLDMPEDALLPIKVRGRGEYNHVLDFCDSEWNLQWRISQSVNDKPAETGLNFSANNSSRLFIEHEYGNVGFSTEQPSARLHISQLGNQDCIRIDDEAGDTSPFIIDSTGAMGLGTLAPGALFHLTNSGEQDCFRVDDKSEDDSPFVIKNDGNVGVGYSASLAKVAINGGLNVGGTADPGDKNASIQGNLVVYADTQLGVSDQQTITVPAQIQSVTVPDVSSKVVVNDSLQIKQNVAVTGSSELGTAAEDSVTINGNTTLNETLTVKKTVILGDVEAEADAEDGNVIIKSSATIDKNLTVTGALTVTGNIIAKDTEHVLGNVTLGDADEDIITIEGSLVSGHSSDKLEVNDALHVSETLNVDGNVTLGNSNTDTVTIEGTLTSGNSSGKLQLNDALHVSQTLDVVGDINIGDSLQLGASQKVTKIANALGAGTSSDTLLTEHAIHQILPKGSIIMWAGSATPVGWALCDGKDGRPNLLNKFIVGAGDTYDVGNAAGSLNTSMAAGADINISGSITVAKHRLTDEEMPPHRHGFNDYHWIDSGDTDDYGTPDGDDSGQRTTAANATFITGGVIEEGKLQAKGHSHTASMSSGSATVPQHDHTILPPYYALCFLIKVTG